MKTVFTTLAALLATLCTVSTALGGNFEPAADPAPKDASTASVIELPKLYYSPAAVTVAPRITQLPADIIDAEIGSSVEFIFKYAGIPAPFLKFLKHNSVPVNIANTNKYSLSVREGTCKFIIKNVQITDKGVYEFTMKNDAGEASCSVLLTVKEKSDTNQ